MSAKGHKDLMKVVPGTSWSMEWAAPCASTHFAQQPAELFQQRALAGMISFDLNAECWRTLPIPHKQPAMTLAQAI